MIITFTPNPSIDRAVVLDNLAVGGVNRAEAVRQDPGGKGVNVSRALAAHGEATVAVMPLGGAEGSTLARLLDEHRVDVAACPVDGSTRMNLTLAARDGVTTKVNEPGPTLQPGDVRRLLDEVRGRATPGSWVLGAGSLPPGAPDDLYVRLIDAAREAGARVAIDSSGVPFNLALAARPDLVKPNHHELGEALGRSLTTLGDVIDGARELTDAGTGVVVVSLGGSGAVAVTTHEVVAARARKVKPLSTVGAGDALLAGMLLALSRGDGLREALGLGVRFGTAAVALPGSVMPGPHDLENVAVTLFDHFDLDSPVVE